MPLRVKLFLQTPPKAPPTLTTHQILLCTECAHIRFPSVAFTLGSQGEYRCLLFLLSLRGGGGEQQKEDMQKRRTHLLHYSHHICQKWCTCSHVYSQLS